jgi:hypothetical protein
MRAIVAGVTVNVSASAGGQTAAMSSVDIRPARRQRSIRRTSCKQMVAV